jgi:uncharacterized membrane protein YgcG
MRLHRPIQRFIFLALPIALLPGCLSSGRKPLGVVVRDAETRKPIPRAEVRISDPLTQPSIKPYDTPVLTGIEGVAQLGAEPNAKNPMDLEAFAKGYQSGTRRITPMEIEAIESAHWFEQTNKRAPKYTLDLYSGAPFSVELLLPPGFRGLIKVEIALRQDMACPPGQRIFTCQVAPAGTANGTEQAGTAHGTEQPAGPSGTAQLIGPAILDRVPHAAYLARSAEGTIIENRMDATKVGFRWLKHDGDIEYYVVGTQKEFDVFRQQYCPDLEGTEKATPKSSKGGGGGKGGRGGGGRGGGGGGGGGGMGGGGSPY